MHEFQPVEPGEHEHSGCSSSLESAHTVTRKGKGWVFHNYSALAYGDRQYIFVWREPTK